MRIIQPYAKIISNIAGYSGMRAIEWAARISHRSEESQTESSWRRFIEEVVLKHGDSVCG